jgi:3-dehydroquinate synthetase
MDERITVGLGDRAYPIWIGTDILENLADVLREVDFPRKVAVVTNGCVAGLYGERILHRLRGRGFSAQEILLPDGEEYKNVQTLMSIYDALTDPAV